MKHPPTDPPTDAQWNAFLRERHLVILDMTKDGYSFEHIASTLSMDPMQVQLISMTPEASTRPHAREWRRR